MISEINSHYSNDLATADQKTWSFNCGQMFAELYDLGMRKGAFSICEWSVFESGGSRTNGDLSLFDFSGGKLKGRSSYYHALMLGQNLKTKYLSNADNKGDVSIISMGDSTGFAIMILNKNNTKPYEYSLGLNGAYVSEKELKIKVSAGIDKEFTGIIGFNSTKMMVFNTVGQLIKQYSYNETDANSMNAPTIELFNVTGKQQTNNVKGQIEIFPIPVVDNVIFNNIGEYQSIEIFNQVGQLLKTIKNSNAESRTIDMVNYSRGIYVVRFLNSTSQATHRIVKE